MDTDANGEVSQYEFLEYFASTKAASLKVLSWGGSHAAPPEQRPSGSNRSGRVSRKAQVPE